MFNRSIDHHIKKIIRQGRQEEYLDLFRKIVKEHRETFTEENLPTAEYAILAYVNTALDDMWGKEGCVRDMGVYKSFIEEREEALAIEKKKEELRERCEIARLLKKYGNPEVPEQTTITCSVEEGK